MIHISLAAETVGYIWGLPVTNALLTTWIVMGLVIAFSCIATRRLALIPGNIQSVTEIAIDGLRDLFESILHERYRTFFPLLATLFIFIILVNWSGLVPGVGTIGIFHGEEFTPLFRSGTADLNTTIALALISVATIQLTGLKTLGFAYLKKFLNVTNPINFFVGILELVSEVSKIISFAFRLFGNIFAGEVLLTVIAFLIPLIAPLPFLGLELFVGFIQALVFSMLTSVFLLLAMSKEGH